jgi:hypothetical protein
MCMSDSAELLRTAGMLLFASSHQDRLRRDCAYCSMPDHDRDCPSTLTSVATRRCTLKQTFISLLREQCVVVGGRDRR